MRTKYRSLRTRSTRHERRDAKATAERTEANREHLASRVKAIKAMKVSGR